MADAVLKSGLSMKDVQYLGLRTDADERLLINDAPTSPQAAWSQEDRLKFYVGRKSIGRYGCYACHDIPGFESAKPIGTALNDWGKKDTERLAFENIIDYVTRHHQVPGHKHANGGEHGAGHPEYDPFFFHALEAHRRDGFLHQKLKAPRSYDYGKLKDRAWDDRLKMPEFKFARPRKKQGETEEEFTARAAREEHESVEAVMTFILGLVAEPVPMKFVNQPRADRLYEVKGQKILERHNCIGCHVTKPGGYEFNLNALIRGETTMRQHLEGILGNVTNKEELARDPVFPEHNAWRTQLVSPPGRSVARGLVRGVEEDDVLGKQLSIDLWEALRFQDDKFQSSQIPAGFIVRVPVDPNLQQFAPTGGNFADVLQRVLAKLENKSLTGDRGYLMSSVPPPLIRQGQKVQPQWLYEFLRHPHGIRPAVQRNLQMPRFQLEHEEIEGIINYFIAVDRLSNPAIGVEHFPPKPAAQDPDVQELLRTEFLQRVQQLMPPGKTASSADYFEAGWRLLTDKNLCIKCHNIGHAPGFQVDGPTDPALQAQNLNGPNLNMAAERLRPEYLERYLSQPKRFLPYTLMPQYDPFFAPGPDYHAAQMGLRNPRDRLLLQFGPLLSPTAPSIPLTIDGRVYEQLELEFALRPDEKVRAVRDALMSWGFMPVPPPTGQKAGPRGDTHGRGASKGGSHR
jgi:mono/diheme cytochrome c family protein